MSVPSGQEKTESLKSVERVLHILAAFNLDQPEYSANELVEKLSLPKGSIYRFLRVLLNKGFLEKNQKTGKFRLGIKIFELGSVAWRELELRKLALPPIEELSMSLGETVHLGVLDGYRVVSIEGMESGQSLRTTLPIGKRVSIHSTGIGKAILAFLPDETIAEIAQHEGLPGYTEHTITSLSALYEEVANIRQCGYAVDNEENEPGVRCVAAPIKDNAGKAIASISISGPSVRVTKQKIPEYSRLVMATSREISRLLALRPY